MPKPPEKPPPPELRLISLNGRWTVVTSVTSVHVDVVTEANSRWDNSKIIQILRTKIAILGTNGQKIIWTPNVVEGDQKSNLRLFGV